METKILYENKWLNLIEISGDNWSYVFSHEIRCKGRIIAVLPFKKIGGRIQYLLRIEPNPAWGYYNKHISSITGGHEKTAEQTALLEIQEEAGYSVNKDDLIDLGVCRGTKSTDTVFRLFSVDLSGKERKKAEGDGSELEKKSYCYWADEKEINNAVDPLVYVMFYKLTKLLNL